MKASRHFFLSTAAAAALAAPTVAAAQTSSPFDPPEEELGVYVVNSGAGLDTGCTFRSGGPLEISLEVPVVVNESQLNADGTLNDAAGLVERGVIGDTAVINFPVFDIDSGANIPDFAPEVDVVSFNGVEKDTLTGSNNQWTNDSITVDIDEVKFGQPNILKIDIDTANSEEVWCMAVDWVSIEFDVAYPYVLAHGINTTGPDTWTTDIQQSLDDYGVLYDFFTVDRRGTTAANASDLEGLIANFLEPTKSDKVHIIAHSKGGLDTQSLQALDPEFEIRSLSTLSTPHLGSVVADLNIILLTEADRRENIGEDPDGWISSLFFVTPIAGFFANVPERPGLDDLTTQAASQALSNGERGNISPTFAIAGDADLNADGELQNAERPFFRADIPWNVMRNFTSARIVRFRTEPGFLGFGERTVLEYRATVAAAAQENDIVVTVNSSRPSYATDLGIVRAWHSDVVDFDNIDDFLDQTVGIRD